MRRLIKLLLLLLLLLLLTTLHNGKTANYNEVSLESYHDDKTAQHNELPTRHKDMKASRFAETSKDTLT